jgi:hypothetical protein
VHVLETAHELDEIRARKLYVDEQKRLISPAALYRSSAAPPS